MEATLRNFQLNITGFAKGVSSYRIKNHLRRVEKSLRKHTPAGLTSSQLDNRINTLDHLNTYWRAGDFPVNEKVKRTTPVFKDEYGNYCAVGYLLFKSGFDSYVNEIQQQNNYVRVREIADKRYLAAIGSLGITKEEAARIQPTYGFEDPGIYSSASDSTVSLLKLASIVLFILLQLFAYLCFKEMNLNRAQKFLSFFTLFLFSSLIMTGIWSILLLVIT